jgi:hypothetical protein
MNKKIVTLDEKITLKPSGPILEETQDNWMYSLTEDTVQLEDIVVLKPATITRGNTNES